MKVVDFNGKEHKINLALYIKKRPSASKLHNSVRELLAKLFPFTMILEEVPLPGTRLFADFFIPTQKLIVEAHGQQHYKFNGFHFASKGDFIDAQKRDKQKKAWAELNGLQLIALPYNEDVNEWTERIAKRNDETETSELREDTE